MKLPKFIYAFKKTLDNLCGKRENDLKEALKKENEFFYALQEKVGFNRAHFWNQVYLVKKRSLIPENISLNERVDLTIKNLGIIGNGSTLDSYYGHLVNFACHHLESRMGASFSPINYLITELKKKFPEDEQRLDVIKRRLIYLIQCHEEIEYIVQRYDPVKIELLDSWIECKVENYIRLAMETALLIVQYFLQKSGSKTRLNNFENLLDEWDENEPGYLGSLTLTMDSHILLSLRHAVVHSTKRILSRRNNELIISFENERVNTKFGLAYKYLRDAFELCEPKPKMHNTWIIIRDVRFEGVSINYYLGKKGTPCLERTSINFNLPMLKFIDDTESYLFILTKTLFMHLLNASESKK